MHRFTWVYKLFYVLEKMGLHLSRVHHYTPIPDTRDLKDELWTRQSELPGLKMNEEKQLKLLEELSSRYRLEYDEFHVERQEAPHEFYLRNGFFGPVDAEILYSMIRHHKPRRVIEIGAGNSTYLAAKAIHRNKAEDPAYSCDLVSIDPYPNETLRKGFPGLTRLIPRKVQEIPMKEFKKLQEDDILFIDSSHVVRIGGDVKHMFLEILPRINEGVLVHVHDVFLPMEYPKLYVKDYLRFWSEQYLLQAFLAFNDSFEVLWGSRYMRLRHPEELASSFKNYDRDEVGDERMSSLWMKRTRE